MKLGSDPSARTAGKMRDAYDEGTAGALTDRYGTPPFTQLNTREGTWRQRKAAWQYRIGMTSRLGRPEGLIAAQENLYGGGGNDGSGTSIFDPVLAETAYRWYTRPGDQILDPFAGGSVRGIVAARTGRQYHGVDLSEQQVVANIEQAQPPTLRDTDPVPIWACADSRDLLPGLAANGPLYDYVFSCPPYHDLEQYSTDPLDLSNMPWEDFAVAYEQVIGACCQLLKPDRFAAFVVGDIRHGQHGYMRPFAELTVDAFSGWGCELYDKAVLLTPIGTGALRAANQFNPSRKLVRVHQYLLVFCKGDPRAATARLGELSPLEDVPDLVGHDQLTFDV